MNKYIFIFILISLFLILTVIFIKKTEIKKSNNFKNEELSATCKNCNIIVLDIDVLRADAFNCNENLTPNFCRFFKDSVFFENNISHSDTTRPNFISFITSLYPSSHTIWTPYIDRLNKDVVPLPEILKAQNYKTILGINPYVQSAQLKTEWFDQKLNYGALEKKLESLTSGNQPFFLYVFNDSLHFPYMVAPQDKNIIIPQGFPTTPEELHEAETNYISSHYSQVFKTEAINAYPDLFNDPEKNKNELYALFNKFSSDLKLNRYIFDDWSVTRNTYLRNFDIKNPQHIQYLKARYLTSLKFVDKTFSLILKTLEKNQFKRNSVIVLKSNHGEEFYEHGSCCHENNLYQELIHTPLIIKLPNSKPEKVNALTQDIDIMPTLLDLLGLPQPPQTQGTSLIPLIEDKTKTTNNYQIAQKGEGSIAAFRKNDKKLILIGFKPAELYDLANDPNEQNNLIIHDPENVEAAILGQEYQNIIKNLKIYKAEAPAYPIWIDELKKERLKKEGYF